MIIKASSIYNVAQLNWSRVIAGSSGTGPEGTQKKLQFV